MNAPAIFHNSGENNMNPGCGHCQFIFFQGIKRVGNKREIEGAACLHPDNAKEHDAGWFGKMAGTDKSPEELNKNLDCPWFMFREKK